MKRCFAELLLRVHTEIGNRCLKESDKELALKRGPAREMKSRDARARKGGVEIAPNVAGVASARENGPTRLGK